MVKINVATDCENAPRKKFIRDFETSFALEKPEILLDSLSEDIYWEMAGDKVIRGKSEAAEQIKTMVDGFTKELTIENIITHGDTAAANGTMVFSGGSTFNFCDIFTFTSHSKNAKIKKITSFVTKSIK